VTGGLIGLVAALVVATAVGLVLRRYSGRFRSTTGSVSTAADALAAAATTTAGGVRAAAPSDALTEEDLGAGLGERATLVQFSTAFCAPCRPTRQILAQVAGLVDGVVHIDIDATSRLDLVRRLRVNSTPTILVLGPDGVIAKRASGLPRKADVLAALGQVIDPDPSTNSTTVVDNVGNSTNGLVTGTVGDLQASSALRDPRSRRDPGSDSRSESE
jgi:thiol-disulfide isomerase/thioredoxin